MQKIIAPKAEGTRERMQNISINVGDTCETNQTSGMYGTYDAVEGGPELMRHHGKELLLDTHTLLKVLNQLQPTCKTLRGRL